MIFLYFRLLGNRQISIVVVLMSMGGVQWGRSLPEILQSRDLKPVEISVFFLQSSGSAKIYCPPVLWAPTFFGDERLSWSTSLVLNNIQSSNFTNQNPEQGTRRFLPKCNTIIITILIHYSSLPGSQSKVLKKVSLSGKPGSDIYLFISNKLPHLRQFFQLEEIHLLKYPFGILTGVNKSNVMVFCPQNIIPQKNFDGAQRITSNNLRGTQFNMAGIHIPPLLMSNRDGVVQGGSLYEMYRLCSSQFNFTVNYHFGRKGGGGTGGKMPNGTWTGIMGDLLTRKVDQSAVLRLTPSRYGLVDFSNFLTQDQPVFYKAVPPPRSVKWDAMIRPFQGSVWILMTLTATSLASVIFVLITWAVNSGKKKLRRNNNGICKREDKQVLRFLRLGTSERWSYSIFLIYSLALDQGSDEIVICTRRVLSLWLFCTLIMGTVYKDKLYLFLTFPLEEETPTDLGGLANRPDYSIVYNYWKSSLYNSFQTSGDPIHQNVFQRFELEPNIVSCVVRAIFESNTVCVGFEAYIDFTIASNATIRANFYPGRVSSSIMNHDPMYLGLAFQRNSIYTEAWNTIVGMVRDSGILSKLQEQVLDTHKNIGRKWLLHEREAHSGGEVSGDVGTLNPTPPITSSSLFQKLQNLIGNFEKRIYPLNTRHLEAILSTWICLCLVSGVVFMVEIKKH